MWRSRRTGLSNNWTALPCVMKWVTGLVDQAFPLCSQARTRMEQGEDWRRPFSPFPLPSGAPPAFGHNSPAYFLVLQFDVSCSSQSRVFEWLLLHIYLLLFLMFASVSSSLLPMPVLKLQYLTAFSQSCLPFHTNSLLPSTFYPQIFTLFTLNFFCPQIPPWEPVLL